MVGPNIELEVCNEAKWKDVVAVAAELNRLHRELKYTQAALEDVARAVAAVAGEEEAEDAN